MVSLQSKELSREHYLIRKQTRSSAVHTLILRNGLPPRQHPSPLGHWRRFEERVQGSAGVLVMAGQCSLPCVLRCLLPGAGVASLGVKVKEEVRGPAVPPLVFNLLRLG